MRRSFIIRCGAAALAAALAGASSAAEQPVEATERKVSLQWQTSDAPMSKAERIQRGFERRNVERQEAPQLPPLRAWKRPDGTEEIGHAPTSEVPASASEAPK